MLVISLISSIQNAVYFRHQLGAGLSASQRARERVPLHELGNLNNQYNLNMKKTIIALMALAGVAVAEDWTATFKTTDTSNKQTWNNYSSTFDTKLLTLSFTDLTISGTSKNGTYTAENPGNQFNTAIRPNANVCAANADTYTLNFTVRNEGDEEIIFDSITLNTFLYNKTGNGHNYNDFAETAITCTLAYGVDLGTTFSTTYGCDPNILENTNGTQEVDFSFGDKSITLASGEQCNFAVTFAKDKGNGSFVGLSGATFSGQVVPEPTTATLSLLALAGLAARRRRR